MKLARRLLLGLPLAVLLVLAVACDTGDDDSDSDALAQLGGGSQGIQVTGSGSVSVTPDVALLSLGVETLADSVAAARGEAAIAMAAIMDVLRARGIEERDIQTGFLNISPEYTYQEIMREGARFSDRVLIGYRVNNNVVVKVRDLNAAGDIIDEAVQAGGDATRVDGLRFTAEDTSEARRQARENAVMDAIEKAEQLALHAGESRGSLVNLSEAFYSSPEPYYSSRGSFDAAFAMEGGPTPVSAGQLEVRVEVHAFFEFEGR
ncbi:MAG: SIMPL domain-containing protein [Chloroflexota bacterium]|nr:SIMPL domain-containing protein [Chloroflexota bacterium]MDE2941767.1 SIMPL domain-containing protein [Chloroflexota bacterium]MDE3268492.1 SIMPL domain-containing protein [Chloroflexota bacterium]